MKKTRNFSARNRITAVYCRFDIYGSDCNYLFTMLIHPDVTSIQLPMHVPPGRYSWRISGAKIEKNGIIQLGGTDCVSLLLDGVVVADL